MADAPVHELSREVARLILVAGEQGESATVEALRSQTGLGAHDLASILDQLSGEGLVREETPGEWVPADEPVVEPEPVRVQAPGDDPGAIERWDVTRGHVAMTAGIPTVRLTVGIAAALDAQALGAMVKAGIEEAVKAGEIFVLEVSP